MDKVENIQTFRLASYANEEAFFLIYTAFIWVGMIMGFGTDISHHLASHARPYPWIVQLHSAVFVAWLAAFTAQIVLIRRGSAHAHKVLGQTMAACIPILIIVGTATAYIVQRNDIGTKQFHPAFFSAQVGDLVGFLGLIVPGFLMRRNPAAHMRLMMLATLQISTAGFSRWLGGDVGSFVHFGAWGKSLLETCCILYFTNDVMVLGIGVYDLIARRKLYLPYVLGVAWAFGCQAFQVWLYITPGWVPIAKWILGAA